MGKSHNLLSMLAGAAIAGGIMYLKNNQDKQTAEDVLRWKSDADRAVEEAEKVYAGVKHSQQEAYTGEDQAPEAEESPIPEINVEALKAEAKKAAEVLKGDAKVVGAELLAGLKAAAEDMKVAIGEAQRAAAARHAEAFDEEDTTGESIDIPIQ